jgi:cytochrome c-type biogenesis protein CcmF
MDALGLGQLSVGPPYFNAVFIPVMLPFFIVLGIGPYVRWKHGDPTVTARTLRIAGLLALVAGAIALAAVHAENGALMAAGVTLAAWAGGSAFIEPLSRLRQRLQGRHVSLPRAVLGRSFAHLGAACLVLGVTVTSLLGVEQDVVMKPGQTLEVAGYQFAFQGVHPERGPNYDALQGVFQVTRGGNPVAVMRPEKREFASVGNVTTTAAIEPGLFRDLYLALGNSLDQDAWSVRIEYKPLVRFIWLGGILMMLGGMLAASDRRYRQKSPAQAYDVGQVVDDSRTDKAPMQEKA